jgi:molybdopterin-containing oxidoreductase family iron-sulfur binding subunit
VDLKELLKKNGGYRLLAELGTKPRIYYLPPKDRLFEFRKGPETEYKENT